MIEQNKKEKKEEKMGLSDAADGCFVVELKPTSGKEKKTTGIALSK